MRRRTASASLVALLCALVMLIAPRAWAASACGHPSASIDRCACCSKAADTDDLGGATIRARCCAIAPAPATAGARPSPVATHAPLPTLATPPVAIAIAVADLDGAPSTASFDVVARAIGPPLWLRTRVLRL